MTSLPPTVGPVTARSRRQFMAAKLRRHGEARREPLNDEQMRLLRITGRMPLASVANLASSLGASEDRMRAMLGRLRSGGWVSSVMRGITERRQPVGS